MDPLRPADDAVPPIPVKRPAAWSHYLWVAGPLLVLVLALHFLGPILTPFLIGAIVAYLGKPVVDRLQRRRVSRTLGALIVVLIFMVLMAALFIVLTPLVQAEVITASHKLPDLFAAAMARITPWVEEHFDVTLSIDAQSVRDYVANNTADVRAVTMHLLSGVRRGGLILITLLVNAALVPVVMFYLLRDWNLIAGRFLDLVPRRWDEQTVVVVRDIDNVLAEFLRGQLSVMIVLALY